MVSEIGLGSWLTHGWLVEPRRSEACIRRALERGINLIDTANSYAQGATEAFLGRALRAVRRDTYVLATKVYFAVEPAGRGLSRGQICAHLDASLRRLCTDHVDLYQCHRYDAGTPLEETMRALEAAVRAGKVRHVGFSDWTPAQIREALALSHVIRFVGSQPQYSILWRAPEREVLPLCAAAGIGTLVWSPLAQGVLTGKYQPRQPPPGDSRAVVGRVSGSPARDLLDTRFLAESVLVAVQALRPIAARAGLTLAQLALAWVLRHDCISSALIGATRSEQIDENCDAAGVVLDSETLTAIDAATLAVAHASTPIGGALGS